MAVKESAGARKIEQQRLLQDYSTAAAHYSWAVAQMSRQMGVISIEEYEQLKKVAEAARIVCREAAQELARFRGA